ncbi:hypothetical protein [Micromonospora sp. NPDC005710]|uniref:hypothetical protein n=1 Tax=Micromonospora sp. NPDC005710 TaxID=3157051 RepID=UPI00340241CD
MPRYGVAPQLERGWRAGSRGWERLPLAMIIGQVRATAIDLLRGVDPDHDAAVLARVDDALGLPPV